MAPQLWAEQLRAGAWGITVANRFQLGVARAAGVSTVMVANCVLSPVQLRWIADDLAADPDARVLVWIDSRDGVALMEEALAAAGAPRALDVLVERGGVGGRTGARDHDTAMAIARDVADAPHLRLAGVAGYEGALAHDCDADSRRIVQEYLRDLTAVHAGITEEGLHPDGLRPVVTAGGSAFFDDVAQVLGPLTSEGVRVVLRSGAYLVHDDGFYRHISPLGSEPRTEGERLRSAMHAWVRVISRPEPGMAIFDAGKRDVPFDEGLPEAQLRRPRSGEAAPAGLDGVAVTAVNDQHGFFAFDPSIPPPLQVGDEVRLGLSHPCTAFDKWTLIPVVDSADSADPRVVDLIRTWF